MAHQGEGANVMKLASLPGHDMQRIAIACLRYICEESYEANLTKKRKFHRTIDIGASSNEGSSDFELAFL